MKGLGIRDLEIVKHIKDKIDKEYTTFHHLKQIQDYLEYTFDQARTLNDNFQIVWGKTIRQYADELRLARAEQLLREGYKVYVVAMETGYKSKKNFLNKWKKHYKMTPLQWRNEQLAKVGRNN